MRRRLLLVDDDPAMAAIVAVLARRAECDFACAPDAESATPLLPGSGLVLLDVNLRGLSGPQWLLELTERPPVALFVQGGLAEDIAAGWDAGADYLFAKELVADPPAWRARLDEILAHADGHGGRQPLGFPAPISEAELDGILARLPPVLSAAIGRRGLEGPIEGLAARLADQAIRLLGAAALVAPSRGHTR